MEKNDKPYLPLRDALNIAAKSTRKRTIRIWTLANFYIPRRNRKYAYLCYTYLRWVDDYVDNPNNDKLSKLKFVENQLKLIRNLSDEDSAESANPVNFLKYDEEFFLYYYIKYAQKIKNDNLIIETERSTESIWLDAKRLLNGGIFSKDELSHYIDTVVVPLFNIIYYFIFPSVKTLDKNKNIGKSIWYGVTLRDFFEDIDMGYINISKEDITKYNLNIADLKNDKKRFNWMANKYPELFDLFYKEICILKSMPFKAKLFWFTPYLVVLRMLIRIKVYDYNFGEKYKRNFIRELKVYSEWLSLSFKTILKVFF